jgi:ubiquinone/menaquinone biosynthesis C-methylase UbiE
MLCAVAKRTREDRLDDRLDLALAPMESIQARDRGTDLVVAHGIWNLARSAVQFRRALDETARVAKPGAGLFVFTSRGIPSAADGERGGGTLRPTE